jgi:hypothetical protein
MAKKANKNFNKTGKYKWECTTYRMYQSKYRINADVIG